MLYVVIDRAKSQCSSSPDGTTYEGYGERQLTVAYSLHQGRNVTQQDSLHQETANSSNHNNTNNNNTNNNNTSSASQHDSNNGDSSPSTDFNTDSSYLNSAPQQ